MKTIKRLLGLSFMLVACSCFATEKYPLSPSKAKVENLTVMRSQIVLNGVWQFAPSYSKTERPNKAEFGRILVPGFWKGESGKPSVVHALKTPLWKNIKTAKIAWFKRSVEIPADWQGREIFIQFERIYNDASIFVDGKYAGKVLNNEGEVDITKFVTAGKVIEIEAKVSAFVSAHDFLRLSKMSDEDFKKAKTHYIAGISGDVILGSRPSGAQITGAFIRTSVRRMELYADVELKNISTEGEYDITARVLDKDGKCVKQFTKTAFLQKSVSQVATISDIWENAKLWDIDSPTLYNLELTLSKGKKVFDIAKERFGFREFEISGKDFLLNGKKIHLQPLHCFWEAEVGGSRTAIANSIDSMLRNNFNTLELWPWDQGARGATHCRPTWAKIADEKGLLLFYPARGHDGREYRRKGDVNKWEWEDPKARKLWQEKAVLQWKPIRNCPSVVAFATMPNRYSVSEDQSPMVIGNRARLQGDFMWQNNAFVAIKAIEALKLIDSTRPIVSHDGGNVGDIHGMNHYLDFLPLQEREEWLSQWSATGTMPYMAIEFGTPFICNFQRDRSNPYRAWCSEPLLTEYCATYFGETAYDNESQAYRDMIAKEHVKDLVWKKLVNLVPFEFAKNNADFQALFIKNTWRSWRTWGISGGMIPWRDAYGWEPTLEAIEHPYQDGALGWQPQRMSKRAFYGMGGKGAKENASALALIENMKPTLMWIGGKKDAFTDKTHHFYGDEQIEKQIIAINDLRKDTPYNFGWKISLGGKVLAEGKLSGVAKVAERVFLPIQAKLPSVPAKTLGEITVSGTFGADSCSDKFTFAVYPQAKFVAPKKLYVVDATGSTIALLKKFNANFEVWNGSQNDGVLIVGENSYGKFAGDLKEYVKQGGKLLILGQDVETLEADCGFRASRYVERRVYPIKSQANHPIIKGFDSEDFRDWAGETTRVERFSHVDRVNLFGFQKPKYGYHWGNRGSVASVMVEKPHYSSWRAIAEGQFDLAFTPLMEREFGKGLAVFCAFDIAGRTQRDPVADELFCRIVSYLDNFKPQAERSNRAVCYVGGAKGEAFLKSLGMKYAKSEGVAKSGLVVIGENSGLSDEQILSAVENGANVMLIDRPKDAARFGLKLKKGKITKAVDVPNWVEFVGLSRSDVRTRADIECNVFDSPDTAICGTVAKIKKGKGTLLAFSLLADDLDTKAKPYLRTTAWRMARTFVQLSGNLGASFKCDDWIFNTTNKKQHQTKIMLNGLWAFSYQADIKGQNPESVGFDDSKWERSILNRNIDPNNVSRAPLTSPYWARKSVFIPRSWKGKKMTLQLGKITGGDALYVNGKKVAETKTHPESWKKIREYDIDGSAVEYGKLNTFAIYVDPYSSGRFYLRDEDFFISAKFDWAYSHDYIENHPDGDSPFRYMKW